MIHPSHTRKIIALDDNQDILESLQDYLSDFEFDLYTATDSPGARALIEQHGIDLLLVDLKLKNESGLDFAKEVYSRYQVPIIMISAVSDSIEKVLGLETVLVDYVEKPFDPRVLLARIRAQFRKIEADVSAVAVEIPEATQAPPDAVCFGAYWLDQNKALLMHSDQGEIELTNTEYRLLELLATQAGSVFSRQDLVDQLGLDSSNHMMRNIDVLVLRLRRKIELRPSAPRFLQTRRNKGYVFCLQQG